MMMLKTWLYFITLLVSIPLVLVGCASAQKSLEAPPEPNRELALEHFLQGSLLDQKEEYAKAILEYQDALQYQHDPAIYHAIAKDYSILGKHELAIKMGKEAVRMDSENRTYHETLAEIYINALDIESAIKEFQEVIRIDSLYRGGWLHLARLTQLHMPKKALKVYQEIIKRFGPDENVFFQMAHIYSSMNKLDDAIKALKGILELDSGNFDVKKMLGNFYLRLDSVDSALKIFNDLVELHPENLELRAAIAHAYLAKQDYERAAEQFELVMQKDTLSIDDQIQFGRVFISFIEKDSAVAPFAITLFEQIQRKNPSDWRPYWFLGAIGNLIKDDSSALANFQKVRELASWNPDGWVGVASVYYDHNQFNDAIEVLKDGIKFVPEEFRIYFLLGISHQRMHENIKAASALEKALQLNENSVDAMSALALVYDALKRFEESDSIYERALRIAPKNHLLLNNYSYSLAERGIQLDRALSMAKKAVDQQPENQSYLDTYGWAYFRLGNYKEAKRWIRKAIDLGSKSPVIHEHLGDVYFKLSDKDKAMEYWRKALELDSNNIPLKKKIQRESL